MTDETPKKPPSKLLISPKIQVRHLIMEASIVGESVTLRDLKSPLRTRMGDGRDVTVDLGDNTLVIKIPESFTGITFIRALEDMFAKADITFPNKPPPAEHKPGHNPPARKYTISYADLDRLAQHVKTNVAATPAPHTPS